MGGSGGSFFYGHNVDPAQLARQVLASERSANDLTFQAAVSDHLSQALGEANNRDVEGTQRILDKVKKDLSTEFEDTVEIMFGGSVAKKTYIEGLSDVDALVLINPSQIAGETPSDVKSIFAEKLRSRFGRDCVTEGQFAVTLKQEDKLIQLLPAMRADEDKFKISNEKGSGWATIRPRKFAEKLSAENRELDGKLVPTIKLAKGIIASLPEQQQLSGYHCESLAINVFRGYAGERTTKAMLRYLFENAPNHVLAPIRDSTGQSVHVDEYLGKENSLQRKIAADALGRIGRRMANADASASVELWKEIVNFP
jgi:hypothetical protein